ncbi:hypothetical protein ACHAWF_007462 [Thalassiosira exigua]
MGGKTFSTVNSESERERIDLYQQDHNSSLYIIFPWSRAYKTWWGLTVFAAAFTIFLETYQMAFSMGGMASRGDLIIDVILTTLFGVDVVINFNLAYHDANGRIVFSRAAIARHYLKRMFWVDLIGVIPFYLCALQITGQMGNENQLTQNLSLLRLFKLARVYRVSQFFSALQYSSKVSLMKLTLIRNFWAALVWTHVWACIMFFIARKSAFDPDNTWLGASIPDLTGFEQYVTSLYWSVVTFTTVGYGDFSPVNSTEQIFSMVFMLCNVVIMSWIIGSITLLIVRNDDKASLYRETLHVLDKYSTLHEFDRRLTKRLKKQLKLNFENKEVADEQVLQFFPSEIRRKVLRRLYLPSLLNTRLMMGARQQFVDAFLSQCTVDIFSPGEEVLECGSIPSALFLLLDGTVGTSLSTDNDKVEKDTEDFDTSVAPTSTADSSDITRFRRGRKFQSGDFLNELGFFTESPNVDIIRTRTVCKLLTMCRSNYRDLAAEHPGSAAVVLNNLLAKVEDLPPSLAIHQAGPFAHDSFEENAVAEVHAQRAKATIQDLVKMHIEKQKDDHTTQFCFAASRGDVAAIGSMCDQGFDPNSSDYDQRTALMVASMNGNIEVVTKLLEHHANPNLTDMHGTSALFEATKNNHEDVAKILLEHGGELSMTDHLAASILCQAVFDGDILLIKRLLKAQIQVNAGDYDKRTASHIAASEGNVAAVRILVEAGADLSLEDRWGNTIRSEAERAKSGKVLEYLNSLKK